jgi:hypothetical protein
MDKYYAYDPSSGFETFETEQEARDWADAGIDYYRDDSFDGWDDSVKQISWGEIKQKVIECNKKTKKEAQDEGIIIGEGCDYYVDYKLSSKHLIMENEK